VGAGGQSSARAGGAGGVGIGDSAPGLVFAGRRADAMQYHDDVFREEDTEEGAFHAGRSAGGEGEDTPGRHLEHASVRRLSSELQRVVSDFTALEEIEWLFE